MSAPMSFEKLFVRDLDKRDSSCLKISQCEIGDVGCVVWDAAIVLAKFCESGEFNRGDNEWSWKGRRVIELGSGTGIVGIMAATLGAHVTITDLEDFVPLMRHNIECNSSLIRGSVEARCLKWGTDITAFLPAPDYLIVSDCIYYEESVQPLVKTIIDLSGPETTVLCCYEERTTGNKPALEQQFFKLMKEEFNIENIPLERHDEVFRSDDIHIVKFMRKKS